MYTVITENDKSVWNDQTGIVYHFPRRYINLLKPGTQVIYYKGKLKDKSFSGKRLSDKAHYFGIATIEQVYSDKSSLKKDYFAIIKDYKSFNEPVLMKRDNQYLEHIPINRISNYWRDGVRAIDEETYKRILGGFMLELQEHLGQYNTESQSDEADLEQVLESLEEGNPKLRYSVQYERNSKIRKLAILIHGLTCKGCGFDFEEYYGDHGKGYIHVHHLKPLSEQGGPTKVNPETDLTVLCANCHAMVHRSKNVTLSIKQLRDLIKMNEFKKL